MGSQHLTNRTTLQGDGFSIDVEVTPRADPGRETAALRKAGEAIECISEVL